MNRITGQLESLERVTLCCDDPGENQGAALQSESVSDFQPATVSDTTGSRGKQSKRSRDSKARAPASRERKGGRERGKKRRAALASAETIGDYRILLRLGAGSVGNVYKVQHITTGKIMAARVLHEDLAADALIVTGFCQAVEAASKLNHPHLVSVYEGGVTERGLPYLIMDYIEGVTLEQFLQKQGCLGVERAREVFVQVAEALACMHNRELLHGNIKPGNIMLVKSGCSDFVKLMDTAIGPLAERAASLRVACRGNCGSLEKDDQYVAPEQCLGRPLDSRCDIYCLGATLYRSLGGQHPLVPATAIERLVKRVADSPRSLKQFGPELAVPAWLNQLVMAMVQPEASHRVAGADQVLACLNRRSPWRPPARLFLNAVSGQVRQSRLALYGCASLALALAILTGTLLNSNLATRAAQDRQRFDEDRAMLALLKGDYYSAARWWHDAVGTAGRANLPAAQLARLNLTAADSLISNYKQVPIYEEGCPPVFFPAQSEPSPEYVHRARLAEPFIESSIDEYTRAGGVPANGSLFADYKFVESQLGDDQKYGDYLMKQIAASEGGRGFDAASAGQYAELAEYYRNHHRVGDAEHALVKAVRARTLSRTWSSADELTTLVDSALGSRNYDLALKSCQERLSLLRYRDASGPDPGYFRADAETNYARVLEGMGKEKLAYAMYSKAYADSHPGRRARGLTTFQTQSGDAPVLEGSTNGSIESDSGNSTGTQTR